MTSTPTLQQSARFLVVRSDGASNSPPPESLLEPAILSRFRSMKQPGTRAAFLAARAQVQEAVNEWLGDQADELHVRQHCGSCGSFGHGRPSLIDARGVRRGSVSWSRSGRYVGVALGGDALDVAIDVELRAPALRGLATQVLTSSEQDAVRVAADAEAALLRLWTLKECAVKLGLCELDDFGGFDVELEFGLRGVVWWTGQDRNLVSSGAFSTATGSAWSQEAPLTSAAPQHIRHVVFRRVDPEVTPDSRGRPRGQHYSRSGTVSR